MVKLTFSLFLVLTALFIQTNSLLVYAADFKVRSVTITPDKSTPFALKRLVENINLQVRFLPSAKANYYSEMLEERLGELDYFAKVREIKYIETSASRYKTTVRRFTDLLVKNKLKNQAQKAKLQMENHKKVLHERELAYPMDRTDRLFLTEAGGYLEKDIQLLDSL